MQQDWRTYKVRGRSWQDLVFAVGELGFLMSLIPLLTTYAHIPLYVGLSTGSMLYLFGLCQFSYRNYMAAVLCVVTATVWVLLGLGVHI